MMKPQGAATGAMKDNSNIIIIVKPNPAAGHAELGQLQASVKAGQSQSFVAELNSNGVY